MIYPNDKLLNDYSIYLRYWLYEAEIPSSFGGLIIMLDFSEGNEEFLIADDLKSWVDPEIVVEKRLFISYILLNYLINSSHESKESCQ